MLVGLLVYTAQTVALSVILGWLRLRSGSVWATSLMHAANNVIGGQFFLALFVGAGKLTPAAWDAFSLIPLGILCGWILLNRRLKEGSLELAPSQ